MYRQYPATFFALGLSTFVYVTAVGLGIDYAELVFSILQTLEQFQLDQILIVAILILTGFAYDLWHKQNQQKISIRIDREKYRTFQATMRSVQDIFGNFLNSLLVLTIDAEDESGLSSGVIQELEAMIARTSEKLNKLAGVEVLVEKRLGEAISVLDFGLPKSS